MTKDAEKLSGRTPSSRDGSLFSTRWILEGGHEAEVDYDAEIYRKLLDDLGIGPERDLLSVIFTDYIPTPNNLNPKGHYRPGEHTILIRVFNRLGMRYGLTKRLNQKPLKTEDVNETLIHETRHFFQHMGALAVGEKYEWRSRQAQRRVEKDANKFTRQNQGRYPVVRAISLGREIDTPK